MDEIEALSVALKGEYDGSAYLNDTRAAYEAHLVRMEKP